ncbi:MAG TPA: type II toxin-antitoxin system RelE/ParE family toxin [Caulifigura sp.]|jgi:plasmid stabilization system protein ParE|nr:type II toxin-antitoxin system RelE/ParE family toxin [Caulifigura sp.]
MSTRIVINPLAEQDLQDARRWYEQEQAGSGEGLVAEVEAVLRRIADAAGTHERIRRDVHLILVKRYPYAIYYRMEGELAVVLSVMHTSRNPREWKRRL